MIARAADSREQKMGSQERVQQLIWTRLFVTSCDHRAWPPEISPRAAL